MENFLANFVILFMDFFFFTCRTKTSFLFRIHIREMISPMSCPAHQYVSPSPSYTSVLSLELELPIYNFSPNNKHRQVGWLATRFCKWVL